MFPAAIAAIAASPRGGRAAPPKPGVTTIADTLRLIDTQLTGEIDPTLNDFTSDGAVILIEGLGAMPAEVGTVGRAGNLVSYRRNAAFTGLFDLTYQVQTSTGATGEGVIGIVAEGIAVEPYARGVADSIDLPVSASSQDYDLIANDEGSGPLEIAPGSLTQPSGLARVAIVGGLVRVTRNGQTAGNFSFTYKPRLVDGSLTGEATAVTLRVVDERITAVDFGVTVPTGAAQPFLIDPLALCVATGPMEISAITQPSGASDSAAITGSGAASKINYTRSTTGVGTYTMTYTCRLIANTAITDTGTITIRVVSKWWLKTWNRPGRATGPGYFDSSPEQWAKALGRANAITAQNGYDGATGSLAEATWAQIWGGPANQSLGNLTMATKSQLDWSKSPFGYGFRHLGPNGGFACQVMAMIPRERRTDTGNSSVWGDIIRGDFDDGYTLMGARYKKLLVDAGWTDFDLFTLRPNHEMNQSNSYQVYNNTTSLYRQAMERAFAALRVGFDSIGPRGWRLRIGHSPARNARLGSYQSWVPQSADGGVDWLTLSFHPAEDVLTQADFYRFMQQWDASSYGTIGDVMPASAALGLPYANPEYSPKDDYDPPKRYPNRAADLVYIRFNKFLNEQRALGNLVFDTFFNQDALDPNGYPAPDALGADAWRRAVTVIKALYKGPPIGPAPALSVTPVSVSTAAATIDIDVLASATGSEEVRINQIFTDPPGLPTAAIVGSGPTAKVRFSRNGAANGSYAFKVELTLQATPMLVDIPVTVGCT